MLKSELIDQMAEENPHLTHSDMERVIVTFFETISQTLESGARVELRGFGAFSPRYRKPRVGRNPRTGGTVHVPEKYVPFFRTGKELRERINNTRK